jgi:DNA-cytosine methyltransferase
MSLGFLLAGNDNRKYRVVFSGEVSSVYLATLRRNYSRIAESIGRTDAVPRDLAPVDLRLSSSLEAVVERVSGCGGADVVIGGPPCQGFSNANRTSHTRANVNNELVPLFATYVERLRPPIFVMENVQAIVWMRSVRGHGVVGSLISRLTKLGYQLFPKLLDAVWYGVPQYRTRFFLLGIHRDLGYSRDDFGAWGPFPTPTHGPGRAAPYTTVGDAIDDLPVLDNGDSEPLVAYVEPDSAAIGRNEFLRYARSNSPRGVIVDHVTSRHAPYVIDRYRAVPAGGNWEDIAETMSNYAALERTHSNIYRRLDRSRPSITIGHYRKSMLIHPSQHRGLSLREACRLQSFPDWFEFLGNPDGRPGGLVHKQQQLANAVCPLVSRALAAFLAKL